MTAPAAPAPLGRVWNGATALDVPVDRLRPGPDVRTPGGPAADVDDLAASITSHGVLEPLIIRNVTPDDDDTEPAPGVPLGYVVVAGRRRLAAATAAGLDLVPCLLRADLDSDDGLEVTLIENLHRADLTPVEEARGYGLLADLGHTQTDIAARVGVNQSTVSKRLALLGLDPALQVLVDAGEVAAGTAVRIGRLAPARAADLTAQAAAGGIPPSKLAELADKAAADEAAAADYAAVVDKLEAAGIPVVEEPADWLTAGTIVPLNTLTVAGAPAALPDPAPMDAETHLARHAVCHAAVIRYSWADGARRPFPVHVCTDPASHRWESPASRLAAIRDDQERELAERVAARRAEEARRQAEADDRRSAAAHAVRETAPAVAAALVAAAVAEAVAAGRTLRFYAAPTAEVLDPDLVELVDTAEALEVIAAHLDNGPATAVALAAILAAGNADVQASARMGTYTAGDLRHLDRLVTLGGYLPTGTEAAALAGRTGAAVNLDLEDDPDDDLVDDAGEPMPDEVPAEAAAWYAGTGPADPGRWITTDEEADVIADTLGVARAGRLLTLVTPVDRHDPDDEDDPDDDLVDEAADLADDDEAAGTGGPVDPALWAAALESIADLIATLTDPDTDLGADAYAVVVHRVGLAARIADLDVDADIDLADVDTEALAAAGPDVAAGWRARLVAVLDAAAEVIADRAAAAEAAAAQDAHTTPEPAPTPPTGTETGDETCPGSAAVVTDDAGRPVTTSSAVCPVCAADVRTTTKGRVRPHKRPIG